MNFRLGTSSGIAFVEAGAAQLPLLTGDVTICSPLASSGLALHLCPAGATGTKKKIKKTKNIQEGNPARFPSSGVGHFS